MVDYQQSNIYKNTENKIVNLYYIVILTGFCCGAVLTKKKKIKF